MFSNLLSLRPTAYRAAAAVVRNPVMAEEASDRAIHQLTLAVLSGDPPKSPKAWLRVVARRSACAILRSEWARTKAMDLGNVENPAPANPNNHSQRNWLRNHLQNALTPRQKQALHAALACNTTRAAARTCGMAPRDFRRSLGAISKRGRALLESQPVGPAPLPGCEPGMPV
jgi:DNA-directed RNA polymerase specialized sigma24 family protein